MVPYNLGTIKITLRPLGVGPRGLFSGTSLSIIGSKPTKTDLYSKNTPGQGHSNTAKMSCYQTTIFQDEVTYKEKKKTNLINSHVHSAVEFDYYKRMSILLLKVILL